MRKQETVTAASGTMTTKSVWSGGQLAVELDSDGTSYTYLWGPGRIPLSVTAKTAAGVSTTYAYQVDAMGSVVGMTDAAGTVVATYAYDPWGRVTSTTGTGIAARNPLRYRSYYLDAETDLYYMPARYYDPATYRFLSADPAAPSAGDPGTLNAFAYCQDDPIGAIDPGGDRAEAGGGGGWDEALVENGDLAWGLVASGWDPHDAYAFVKKQRKSASHLAWLHQKAIKERIRAQGRDARAAADKAFWADLHELQREHATRGSWSVTAPQDDPIGYGLSTAGAMCDVLTVATGSTGVGLAVFGGAGMVLSFVQLGYEGWRWLEGDATAADVALAAAGAVPLVDEARAASQSYHIVVWGMSTASAAD